MMDTQVHEIIKKAIEFRPYSQSAKEVISALSDESSDDPRLCRELDHNFKAAQALASFEGSALVEAEAHLDMAIKIIKPTTLYAFGGVFLAAFALAASYVTSFAQLKLAPILLFAVNVVVPCFAVSVLGILFFFTTRLNRYETRRDLIVFARKIKSRGPRPDDN
jgi:hypothetical protein